METKEMKRELEPLSRHKVDRLEHFLKGDKHAVLFCLDLLYVAHLWDDLIDKDVVRSNEDVNQAFIKSLSGIPNNPFYQEFISILLPMMHNALVLWLESNELAKGDLDKKVTAFSLENAVVNIIHFCILVKSSVDWARECSEEFWELFGPTHRELVEMLES
jgi:hypothetical protein